jgi:hypothetical protein
VFGGIPLEQPTRLLGYTIVNRLGHHFIEYDTIYWRGAYGMASKAEKFKLGPGPYLILSLSTDTGNTLVSDSRFAPGWINWTTVRRPWCRVRKCCSLCRDLNPRPDSKCSKCAVWSHWMPVPGIIPKKYRQARGQLVKIVYKPEEK